MTDDLFVARGLQKRFGGVRALDDLEVIQRRGETLGMIGPNGSGKTSFVNAVTGHLRLDSGTLTFAGSNIAGIRPCNVARLGLVRTYQAVRIFSKLTVRENIETACLALNSKYSDQEELLEWLTLTSHLDARAGGLTLFEQRRVELAMRLMLRPQLLMLDEPVGGLAPSEVRAMMNILQQLKSRCTLFVIEHTMKVIRELADRVVVLVVGQKIAEGPPIEILKDQAVIAQYLGTAHA